eukprot:TRINITY_DN8306_c0_g1_i1.p1 TRINITY_DN8306_c0_g1~~TRINITY_DN8306_c0_g1_i1.p1  ORF type:complete len:144 (-),score=14.70 TRINITY_DN8306_c0_g1_i1:66-497(-)
MTQAHETHECVACHKDLEGKVIQGGDRKWHRACFVCCRCTKLIEGGEYDEMAGLPAHPSCSIAGSLLQQRLSAEKMALHPGRCVQCDTDIAEGPEKTGKVIRTEGLVFHKECFKCDACKELISAGPYSSASGHRYHDSCVPSA